jgi:hypothetical protein
MLADPAPALRALRQARSRVRERVWALAGDAAPHADGQVTVDLDGGRLDLLTADDG